jgi:hypothetical protein
MNIFEQQFPRNITESRIVIEVNDEHPLKQLEPRDDTKSEIEIEVNV